MAIEPSALAGALAGLSIDVSSANTHGWCTVVCLACGKPGTQPSLRVNIGTGVFKCFRCGASSSDFDIDQFVRSPRSPSLRSAHDDDAKRRGSDIPPLTEGLIERYHRFLLDSPSIVSDIERKRGWRKDTLEKLLLGWDGGHVWIPIFVRGKLVNAKLYDPFKRTKVKSLHYANEVDLTRTVVWVPFGEESLKGHESVWWFEGEPDGILAAQMGFPTALVIGGAGTWCDDVLTVTGSRRAVLCYDADAAGRRGARAVSARMRAGGIKETIDITIPLTNPEWNDFTDAVMKDRRDVQWFKDISRGTKDVEHQEPVTAVKLGGGVPGERVIVRAHVIGAHMVPLLVPQSVMAKCRVDWKPDRDCRSCPAGVQDGNLRFEVDFESVQLMQLCVTRASALELELRKATGVPQRCPRIEFDVSRYLQVQHIKIAPPMSERQGGDTTMRSAMCVRIADGSAPPVRPNQLYDFTGRIHPDVITNEWTLLSSDSLPAEDDVGSFCLTPKLYDELAKAFNPSVWTVNGIEKSMSAEEDSLARHVTRIYGRRDLFRAVDLTYHSVTGFSFKGAPVTRGWMSIGGVGDTRVGKTELFTSYSKYIGFGRLVIEPANTTYAGLVGGLQQVGTGDKSWVVTWGLIPTNDRGLVMVDECSSMSVDDIGRMSGMRSSGVAELVKIRQASTQARTRLIMFGNPRGNSVSLASFATPVEALVELIGAPEDIARFDYALGVKMGLDKNAADDALGDQPLPIDSGLRRDLVRFAWSRSCDDVKWEKGTEKLCCDLANEMVKDYDYSIPLVEPSEQDLRVARVAVATAVRTFSVDESGSVLVRRCHVEFAVSVMRNAFDGDLGYDQYSRRKSRMRLDKDAASKLIATFGRDLPTVCRGLLQIRRVTTNTIGTVLAMDANESRGALSALVAVGAAVFSRDDKSANASMVWTADFAELLRRFELEKVDNTDKCDGQF